MILKTIIKNQLEGNFSIYFPNPFLAFIKTLKKHGTVFNPLQNRNSKTLVKTHGFQATS